MTAEGKVNISLALDQCSTSAVQDHEGGCSLHQHNTCMTGLSQADMCRKGELLLTCGDKEDTSDETAQASQHLCTASENILDCVVLQ